MTDSTTAADAAQIRGLIERWAQAVHAGDLDTVVADHADDIVMFDVPPPEEGVRGIDAYRETWPPFFKWQAAGASFEIVELEVVAGGDVAYAMPSSAAALRRSWRPILRIGFGSRSASAGRRALDRGARAPFVPVQGLTGGAPAPRVKGGLRSGSVVRYPCHGSSDVGAKPRASPGFR